MRKALTDFDGTVKIGGREVLNLRCADDIDLLAGSLHELQDVLTSVGNESKVIGLNIKKIKWMIISKKALPEQQLSINSKVIEPVDDFIYLDYKINRQRLRGN